jgi:serine protease Do
MAQSRDFMPVPRTAAARIRRIGGIAILLLIPLPGAGAADDAAPAAGPPPSATVPITLPPLDESRENLFTGRSAPGSKADLRALEERFRTVAEAILPCTVGVELGGGSGSGVIVSENGFVLTAGHVSGQPGRKVMIVLQDGRRVPGKTLGVNADIDSGLIKIDGDAKWPYAELGRAQGLAPGTWCLAAGHPGGFQPGRTSPIRVGRILANKPVGIVTDCMLVGGDSGGPLFDARGRVIGINSRIGDSLAENVCVPIDTFRDTWARLAASESWGGRRQSAGKKGDPFIGVSGDAAGEGVRLTSVVAGGPADTAGLKVDDVVRRFGSSAIASFEDLLKAVRNSKPEDRVPVEVERGSEKLTLTVVIGKRAE